MLRLRGAAIARRLCTAAATDVRAVVQRIAAEQPGGAVSDLDASLSTKFDVSSLHFTTPPPRPPPTRCHRRGCGRSSRRASASLAS
jgi:hypothetical protein